MQGGEIMNNTGHPVPMGRLPVAVGSLLIIVIGNLMGKVRQNWFVGFRFPWTLEREDVWNRTNRLGGKLFIAAGLLGLISVLLPPVWTEALVSGSLLLAVAITIIYSVIQFRKPRPN
ncbi:MAG TPA: SdpI family protein, partial [Candidatus Edwardsbacteria bacterium]|nr:SdpI family protein [Candidatus Edwardsbacteria bacterium]